MGSLVVTHVIAWGAIGAYAAWLAISGRRLRQRLERTESDTLPPLFAAVEVTDAA
jgi:hypothetical protein